MGRRPKNEFHRLAAAARAQLLLAEALKESLEQRMKVKKEAAGEAGWIPDEDWRRDFASVTVAIQHAGNSLIRAIDGNKKNMGGLTEEQLVAQLVAEICACAAVIPEDQWQQMVAARARAKA